MTDAELEEILVMKWPRVIRQAIAEGNGWLAGFAKSIMKQSKKPNWRPSKKQAAVMQRVVSELQAETELEVVERF